MADAASQQQDTPAVAQLRSMLQRKVRVTTPQGRTLTGELQCLDKQGNLVLGNVYEELVKSEPRRMGLVLVPLSQQANVELQMGLGERIEKLSLL